MVTLVTQYNNMRGREPFRIGEGWDGANGPWVFHILDEDSTQHSIADMVIKYAGQVSIQEWTSGVHLTSFRLELVYE